ncbi:D-inositol-3-phosphate glycosyltransferase [Gemmata sp. SH-PL17]|nr:D-inositol-3-phosphate glycosyltransferase [Gemmata sp. SH-PL17]
MVLMSLRLLFVKDSLSWPRSSGHDVHCFHMMQALAKLGHEVGLLTATEPHPEAVAGLPLAFQRVFPKRGEPAVGPEPQFRWLQRKFQSYWGVDENRVRAVGQAALDMKADGVVVVGLNVLPYLGAVKDRLRVWYAADEWAWHHVSQVRAFRPRTWSEIKQALIKGVYERAYRPMLDRVWVVTDADKRAMRWVAGVRGIDVVPNGVDAEHFRPLDVPQREHSCTFWGRLDFGPNVQALEWFCGRVWPRVRAAYPNATFTVYGFSPTPAVRALTGHNGIELIADLPDLRAAVATHQAVVFPFVSGGGIKNKFLEAAAMGKPIVCSSVALNGLRHPTESGALVASSPEDWVRALGTLWSDAAHRTTAGESVRRWVIERHSWDAAARTAVEGLAKSMSAKK